MPLLRRQGESAYLFRVIDYLLAEQDRPVLRLTFALLYLPEYVSGSIVPHIVIMSNYYLASP